VLFGFFSSRAVLAQDFEVQFVRPEDWQRIYPKN